MCRRRVIATPFEFSRVTQCLQHRSTRFPFCPTVPLVLTGKHPMICIVQSGNGMPAEVKTSACRDPFRAERARLFPYCAEKNLNAALLHVRPLDTH
jgi:hypothetical protein